MGVSANVRVIIDQMLLEGVSANDRLRVGASVQAELAQLIEQNEMLAVVRECTNLDNRTETVAGPRQPEAMGRQIARAVFRAVSR